MDARTGRDAQRLDAKHDSRVFRQRRKTPHREINTVMRNDKENWQQQKEDDNADNE
ncbi:hypothetical protein FYL99_RS26420 [Escherichia coli]